MKSKITELGENDAFIMEKLVAAYLTYREEAAKLRVAISTIVAVAGIEMPDLDEMEAQIL